MPVYLQAIGWNRLPLFQHTGTSPTTAAYCEFCFPVSSHTWSQWRMPQTGAAGGGFHLTLLGRVWFPMSSWAICRGSTFGHVYEGGNMQCLSSLELLMDRKTCGVRRAKRSWGVGGGKTLVERIPASGLTWGDLWGLCALAGTLVVSFELFSRPWRTFQYFCPVEFICSSTRLISTAGCRDNSLKALQITGLWALSFCWCLQQQNMTFSFWAVC